MATILIDGTSYKVDSTTNLLDAILSIGLNLPYFCWHPAMGSVGACRQCAIKTFKDENDTTGKIVMACMEPVTEGARISINDPEVRQFRASVIEWLMTNHPHDCPVCDEGGECHLQDMTVMTGHVYRRHRFHKRTYRNQNLGPFINHEMNRCIQCYRCVRFYRDYAGGHDLNAFAAHNHVYFGRHQDGVLENEFSGNLVEVCPTGVFTDKTLKQHYTRKWDLTTAPSICHECGLGCNIIPGQRYGSLRRIYSRYNGKVNGYFICDRGRFGYEFVNSEHRVREPLRRGQASGKLEPVDKATVLKHVGKILADGKNIIGVGSPAASLESNFTLRTLVGENNFYPGISQKDSQLMERVVAILSNSPVRTPSLKEAEQADAILVLGEDLTNTAPMLALAVRQAVRHIQMETADKLNIPRWHDAAVREAAQETYSPLYVATPNHTKLDDIATQTFRAAPDEIARLGFAVANALDGKAPAVSGLPGKMQELAGKIAGTLKNAKKPLVVSGFHAGSEAILQAAANVANALHGINKSGEICFAVPEPNSLGLGLMTGQHLEAALQRVRNGDADTVIVLENDLYRRAEKEQIDQFLEKCKHLIVLNYLENETTSAAELVIPAGTFAEADGTLVNNEGRAQRFYQVFPPEGAVQESWRWLKQMMDAAGRTEAENWNVLADFTTALARALPVFNGIENITPPPGFRIAGQKIPRASHRFSGRTAMNAHINIHEPKPPQDPDSPLSFTMEGFHGEPPSSLIPLFWSPGWNSVQSINKYQIEVGGALHGGDPGRRLIEPMPDAKLSYFDEIPGPFQPRREELLVVPLYHIFGSEAFSMYTPAVAERAPKLYLLLNPEDAGDYKLNEGMELSVTLAGSRLNLPVRFSRSLPQGLAGMPVGLPGLPALELPGWGKLSGAGK